MNRRAFIAVLGGAAAPAVCWPLAARAQSQAMPVIGYLNAGVLEDYVNQLRAFRDGLKEGGFVEGSTVTIDYRWAENKPERLPLQADQLVRRPVNVLASASAGTRSSWKLA